jgi:hypothetical protein
MAWRHEPAGTPKTVEDLARYVEKEFTRLAVDIEVAENVELVELHAEPTRPRNGLVVLADGTNWDPGSGAGYYGYHNAAWTFLG